MDCYKIGNSAYTYLLHNKILETDNAFCCVVEFAQEKTLQDAFTEMQEKLKAASNQIVSVDQNALTVKDSNNNEYLLAHEKKIVSGAIVKQPSNIIRHLLTCDFTISGFYLDEHNEVIKLHKQALDDIAEQNLRPFNFAEFVKRINSDTELLYTCLDFRLSKGFCWKSEVEIAINELQLKAPPHNTEQFLKLFQTHNRPILQLLNHYAQLNNYFTSVCGMEQTISFNFGKVQITDPEKVVKPNLDPVGLNWPVPHFENIKLRR